MKYKYGDARFRIFVSENGGGGYQWLFLIGT